MWLTRSFGGKRVYLTIIDTVCRAPEPFIPSFTHPLLTSPSSSSLNPNISHFTKENPAHFPVVASTTGKTPDALWRDDHWKRKNLLKHSQEGRRVGFTSWVRRRQWKAKKTIHKMVLGSDVGLTETCSLSMCRLVGRLSYNYLYKVSLLDWIENTWKPLLGYKPELVTLTKV